MRRKDLFMLCLFCLGIPLGLFAQGGPGIITTLVGAGASSSIGDGGPATQASLNRPADLAVDAKGTIYFYESYNNRYRRISPDGTITTFAEIEGRGTAGGTAGGVAVDAAGNAYFIDYRNNLIRRMGTDGTVTTVAGTGTAGSTGDGGPAVKAQLSSPQGLTVDARGNVYVGEPGRVRRIGTDGIITTVVGTGTLGFSGDGGPATKAQIRFPSSLAADAAGNLYIADSFDHRVRRVGVDGVITTVAGTGTSGSAGDGGPAAKAQVSELRGVAVDGEGNLYVVERNGCRVRKVGPDGIITTFAGTGKGGFSGDGGPAVQALLSLPQGVAVDAGGVMYIADTGNNRIRRVGKDGVIATVAGITWSGFAGDGAPASQALLNTPWGVAVDANGAVYVADSGNSRVQKMGTNGVVTTVAGTGAPGFSGDGGPATQAQLGFPQGVAVDARGNLYIADGNAHRVRRVGADGIITTVAGTGTRGFSGDGGPATQAQINNPFGVAVDADGVVYFSDQGNHRIRRVGVDGVITTIAGIGPNGTVGNWFIGEGIPATQAQFDGPRGVAVDAAGNVYVADYSNHRIRRIGKDGIIRTVAGTGYVGPVGTGDGGPATQATLFTPWGVAVDARGNIYVADSGNHRIRRVGPDGIITTVAGRGHLGFSGDGGPAVQSRLNQPFGVTVDPKGVVYVADAGNHRIRRIEPSEVEIAVTPALVCDNTGVGASSQRAFTVYNPGSRSLSIAGISITGPDAGQFSVSPSGGTVPSGGKQTFTVRFSPASTGDRSAALSIAHSAPGGVTSVALSGAGVTGQPWEITTFAGAGQEGLGEGGPAIQGRVYSPSGVAVDAKGNAYIAADYRIRKVSPDGVITTVAGVGGFSRNVIFSGEGGPATRAQLNGPSNVAIDAAGNLYFGDGYRVRKVGTDGILTTVAGVGAQGFSGDGGPATQAQLNGSLRVAVDGKGNLYISDSGNNRIRKVGTDGIITTVAGTGTAGFSGDDGPATQAQLRSPRAAVSASGVLYITEAQNHRVRRVGLDGIIRTIAGTGTAGFSGDGGPAIKAQLNQPSAVVVDAGGGVYISDGQNQRVRRVGPDAAITTVSGTGTQTSSGDGGLAAQASLAFPGALAVDPSGALYIVEVAGNRIRRVGTSVPSTPQVVYRAGPSSRLRSVIIATVLRDGVPVSGLDVAFSRAISGQVSDYRWKGRTDAGGRVRIEIVADTPQSWRTGVSGYYRVKAADPASGAIAGQWENLTINGGKQAAISLPIDGQARVEGETQLETPGPSAALFPNFPNPFNPETQIAYGLAEDGRVRLTVYNLLGQRVRTLVEEAQAAGYYEVRWNSRDDAGRPLASGMYFYRLQTNEISRVGRMLLLK